MAKKGVATAIATSLAAQLAYFVGYRYTPPFSRGRMRRLYWAIWPGLL